MIVALDSNIVIYLVEAHPYWAPLVMTRTTTLQSAGDEIAVCEAARMECLVKPFATNSVADQTDYRTFFGSPSIRMLSVTTNAWEQAARIRATYNLSPLDAIHLATAIEHGCGLFLTNDTQLSRCVEITVEILT